MPDERNIQRVGQPIGRATIEHHVSLKFFSQHCPKAIAEGAHSLHGCQVARNLASFAEPNSKQRALGFGAAAALAWLRNRPSARRPSRLTLRRADVLAGAGWALGKNPCANYSASAAEVVGSTDSPCGLWRAMPRAMLSRSPPPMRPAGFHRTLPADSGAFSARWLALGVREHDSPCRVGRALRHHSESFVIAGKRGNSVCY
jgi:hypothetical protein